MEHIALETTASLTLAQTENNNYRNRSRTIKVVANVFLNKEQTNDKKNNLILKPLNKNASLSKRENIKYVALQTFKICRVL